MLANDPNRTPQSSAIEGTSSAPSHSAQALTVHSRERQPSESSSPNSSAPAPIKELTPGIRVISWAIEKFPAITVKLAQVLLSQRILNTIATRFSPAAGWEVVQRGAISDPTRKEFLIKALLPLILSGCPERIQSPQRYLLFLGGLDENHRNILAQCYLRHDGEGALQRYREFNLRSDSTVADFAKAAIEARVPSLALHGEIFKGLSANAAEGLIERAAEHAPNILPDLLLRITDVSRRAAAFLTCAEVFLKSDSSTRHLGERLVSLIESCQSIGQTERGAVAGFLMRRDARSALPAISRLGLEDHGLVAQYLIRISSSSVPEVLAFPVLLNSLPMSLRYDVLDSCLLQNPAPVIEGVASFVLGDVQRSNALVREAVKVKPATTAHFIKHFGADADTIKEVGLRAISKAPFRVVPFIENFGEHAPALVNVFWAKACERYPGKAIENAAVLRHLSETDRASAWIKLFARKPEQGVCSLIAGLGLTSEPVLDRIRAELSTKAPELFARNLEMLGLDADVPEFKLHLKAKLDRTPWVVLNTCIATGMRDQEFLGMVLAECFSRNPRRACLSLSAISTLETVTKNNILERWVQDKPTLFQGSSSLRRELDSKAQRILISAVAVREPMEALKLMQELKIQDETLIVSIFKLAAAGKRNAAALCEELPRFRLHASTIRIELASAVVRSDKDQLEDSAVALALSPQEVATVIESVGIKVVRERVEVIRSLGIYDTSIINQLVGQKAGVLGLLPAANQDAALQLALVQARKAPGSTAKKIHEFGLASSEDRMEVARAIAASSFEALSRVVHRFGLSDAQRIDLLRAAAPVTNGRIANFIVRFGITDGAAARPLLHALAVRDLRAITDRPELRSFYGNEEAVWSVFHAALLAHNIKNALYACIVQHENVSQSHVTQRQTLAVFDQLLQRSLGLQDLTAEQRYELELLARVRKYGVAPSSELLKAFQHFDNDADGFLCEVYSQAGPTGGANIVEQLVTLYQSGTSIPKSDQEIIRLFLSSGFRGFSERTFKIAREHFNSSPQQARRLIDSWKSCASAILTGAAVSKEDAANPLFPEMVYAAYRPVGMGLSEVKGLLSKAADHSARLNQFTYPKDGYPTALTESSEVQLRPGMMLSMAELKLAASLFMGKREVTPENETDILVKASQRGVGSLNREVVTAWMMAENPDPRLIALRASIAPILSGSTSSAALKQALVSLQEGFGVITNDSLDFALKQAIDGGRFDVRERFTARVRQLLQKKETDEVTPEEMRAALREELEKVFRVERTLVSKELKKFSASGARHSHLRTYLALSPPAFFARAGAGLCTARDSWSWNHTSYLQMITVDVEKQVIVGNTQLHLFKNRSGEPSVLARLNPTEKFLSTVEPRLLARAMLGCVEQFAAENNLVPFLPEQTWAHLLTNRQTFAGPLASYYGPSERAEVRVASDLTAERVYRMRLVRREAVRRRLREGDSSSKPPGKLGVA